MGVSFQKYADSLGGLRQIGIRVTTSTGESFEFLSTIYPSFQFTFVPFSSIPEAWHNHSEEIKLEICSDRFLLRNVKIELLNENGEVGFTQHLAEWKPIVAEGIGAKDGTAFIGGDTIKSAVLTTIEDIGAPYFLIADINEHKLTATVELNFPLEIRAFCEQYLLYFVEFLRDAGIAATADIEHDLTGTILFKVKTLDSKIALNKIREALEIYLELPSSTIANNKEEDDERTIMLRAEINALKFRLDMAEFKALETEKRLKLQERLIDTQELSAAKDEKINSFASLQRQSRNKFKPTILLEKLYSDEDVIEGEIVNQNSIELIQDGLNKSESIKSGDLDFGLIKVEPAKIGGGVKIDTPRIVRSGVRSLRDFFDWIDKNLNKE